MRVEAGYAFDKLGVAASWQSSDEMVVGADIPETRISVGLNYELEKDNTLAFEYAKSDDYKVEDTSASGGTTGTGKDATSYTFKWAVNF